MCVCVHVCAVEMLTNIYIYIYISNIYLLWTFWTSHSTDAWTQLRPTPETRRRV